LLLLLAAALHGQTAAELDFYRTLNDGRDAEQMLPRYLMGLAQEKFAERARRVRATTDWAAYRKAFREQVISSLGGLPERTPLNARVMGVIQRDGYRIEKVIFESQPRFYVTANLYVPRTGSAPYPAILFPLGHEGGAKAHDAWQRVLGNLARRGFVLLAWDPVGQGERIQLYDEDFRTSKLSASTTEHTMAGIQSILLGDSFARFTIWDGMRALDYLLSRPEVDASRVGITGNSGGGTHSSYLAALEDRIHVAAPSCYLTNWRKLLETIGPQDAEQCFPGFLGAGYDHPDFVIAFAPKPFLILSAIRDFFPILGARETFAEGQRIYDSLGAAGKLSMVEADDGHGYTLPRREAGYRWFTRWLQGREDTSPEQEVVIASEQELACTKTGQVLTSLGGESVYSLNVARLEALRKPGSVTDLRRLTRFEKREKPLLVQPLGGDQRMRKLVYQTEPGIWVPAVLFEPAGEGRKPAVVVAHGRGKAASMEAVRKHLDTGRVVLSIDVRGVGETGPASRRSGDWARYFGDYHSAMTAVLLGKPLVAMRAEDISAAAGYLAELPSVDASRIAVHGLETAGVAALIATTLDSRIASAVIEGGLVSYESVIRSRIHRNVFEQVIPGALRYFDLPDLVRWSAPRKVEIRGAVDAMGFPAGS
jgi:cephalosporin-C deacetylase-like acetyl esterase